MFIVDTIYKYIPVKYFKLARNTYYKLNRFLHSPLSEEEFRSLLTEKLGVEKGMILYVHSSIDKLNIDFSAFRLFTLLQEIVGESGTLVFPCWHYRDRVEDYLKKPDAVFNVKKSPTTMGLLPELARRHKKAFRSQHPTSSIVAIGNKAEELTFEHHLDIYPNGIKSPLFKLMKYKSRIIGLGEKVVSLSFVHVIEDTLKDKFPLQTLNKETKKCKVIDNNGNVHLIDTFIPHLNIANRDTPGFFSKYISKISCLSLTYKGVNYFTADPRLLYNEMKDLSIKAKTIYNY